MRPAAEAHATGEALGVIPARYASTRFPGKPLALLAGKPMVQHVWERARQARALTDLVVATEDERIVRAVEGFGGRAVMTSRDHLTGTDLSKPSFPARVKRSFLKLMLPVLHAQL